MVDFVVVGKFQTLDAKHARWGLLNGVGSQQKSNDLALSKKFPTPRSELIDSHNEPYLLSHTFVVMALMLLIYLVKFFHMTRIVHYHGLLSHEVGCPVGSIGHAGVNVL